MVAGRHAMNIFPSVNTEDFQAEEALESFPLPRVAGALSTGGCAVIQRRRMSTPRGVLGAALEEVRERPIEIPQDLLLAGLGDGRDPIERGPHKPPHV